MLDWTGLEWNEILDLLIEVHAYTPSGNETHWLGNETSVCIYAYESLMGDYHFLASKITSDYSSVQGDSSGCPIVMLDTSYAWPMSQVCLQVCLTCLTV